MAVQGEGLVAEGDGAGEPSMTVHYVLHPNCATEEMDISSATKD